MATQYQVAYSKDVAGAGIIGAGPWLCAQGIVTRALKDCLAGASGGPDVTPLVAALRASAALRAVDDPSGLAADRIWIFHGAKDGKVGAAVSDSLLRFYKAFVPLEQVRYETQVPAAHGFPTLADGGACDADASPWILACGYDAAGEMLKHLYDGLADPSGAVTGNAARVRPGPLRREGRARLDGRHGLPVRAAGLRGRQAVPRARRVPRLPAGHRIHWPYVRAADRIRPLGRCEPHRRALSAGEAEAPGPLNPRGCWDWWGYSGADYAARSGAQLSAIHRMLEALGVK